MLESGHISNLKRRNDIQLPLCAAEMPPGCTGDGKAHSSVILKLMHSTEPDFYSIILSPSLSINITVMGYFDNSKLQEVRGR